MPVIDPFVSDVWIRKQLLGSAALTSIVSSRIHPMRPNFTPIGWPFVLYAAPSQDFNTWAEMITLGSDEYRVYAVMRQDKMTQNVDMETYLSPAYKAIIAALDGVTDPVSSSGAGPTLKTYGTIHSCQIVRPIRRIYSQVIEDTTKQICEMGVVVRLIST